MNMADGGPSRADAAANTRPYGSVDADALARVADALIDAVSINHGGRLSPAQLAEVRAGIVQHLTTAERLHQYPLTNADEPAFGFAAYNGER
jgi:hypothetical protein